MYLTQEQIAILNHTAHRAAAGRYCGNSPDMQGLVELGLMRSIGKAAWCHDEFFVMTGAGREALKAVEPGTVTRRRVE
jgi:hypothetical protein